MTKFAKFLVFGGALLAAVGAAVARPSHIPREVSAVCTADGCEAAPETWTILECSGTHRRVMVQAETIRGIDPAIIKGLEACDRLAEGP